MREYKLSEYIPDGYNRISLPLSSIVTKYFGYEFSDRLTGPVNNFVNLTKVSRVKSDNNIKDKSCSVFGTDIFRIIETRTRPRCLMSRSFGAPIKLEYYAFIDNDDWEGTSIYFGNRSNYSQNKVNEKYRKYRLLKKRW